MEQQRKFCFRKKGFTVQNERGERQWGEIKADGAGYLQ
jgi:hypothetical protein